MCKLSICVSVLLFHCSNKVYLAIFKADVVLFDVFFVLW